MNTHPIIVNELLSYLSFYMNNSAIDNIKKIAINFYDSDDIINSKKVLWENRTNILGPYTDRKKSDKRTVSEANINDIFEALTKLDTAQELPKFVAQNLDKLPERHPEELNVLTLINRVATIEKTMKNHNDVLSQHAIELMELKQDISEECIKKTEQKVNDKNGGKISENTLIDNEIRSKKSAVKSDDSTKQDRDDGDNCNEMNELSDELFEEFLDNVQINQRDSLSFSNFIRENKEMTKSLIDSNNIRNRTIDMNARKLQDSAADTILRSREWLESDGFEMKNGRTNFQMHDLNNSTNDVLVGAPPRLKDIWVYKIKQGNVNTVMKYLKDRNVKVGKVIRTSHVNSTFKSFRIKIYQHDVEKVLNREFWPINVKCKVWKEMNSFETFKGRTIVNNKYTRARSF